MASRNEGFSNRRSSQIKANEEDSNKIESQLDRLKRKKGAGKTFRHGIEVLPETAAPRDVSEFADEKPLSPRNSASAKPISAHASSAHASGQTPQPQARLKKKSASGKVLPLLWVLNAWNGLCAVVIGIWSRAHAIDKALWRAILRYWRLLSSGVIILTDWILDAVRAFLQWVPTRSGRGYMALFGLISIIFSLWAVDGILSAERKLREGQRRPQSNITTLETNPVMARIGGRYIRLKEVEAAARSANAIGPDENLQIDTEFTRELVISFVDQLVLVEAAAEKGLSDQEDLQVRLQVASERIIAAAYIDEVVAENVTEKSVLDFYETQSDIAHLGEEIRARHILVKTKADAISIISAIDRGADFGNLAKSRSLDRGTAPHGGDTGYITRDMVSEKFAQNVFAYKAGAIAPPFETDDGWNVVEILERRTAEGVSFEDVRDSIERFLTLRAVSSTLSELKEQKQVVIVEHGNNKNGIN